MDGRAFGSARFVFWYDGTGMTMSNLVARVRQLLLAPRETLPLTLSDPGGLKDVLVPYVVVLAALGPLAGFLSGGLFGQYIPGQTIFNTTVPGMFVRAPVAALILSMVRFGVGVGSWWLLSFVLDRLAPSFGGKLDRAGAFKTAAALLTPVFLAGALSLLNSVPHLEALIYLGGIAALAYSVLIGMYAVPLQLSVPEPKAVGHVLASLAITVAAASLSYALLASMLVG
jgi:hypothetical protein